MNRTGLQQHSGVREIVQVPSHRIVLAGVSREMRQSNGPHDTIENCLLSPRPATMPLQSRIRLLKEGVYADLVTAPGFKPGVASEKGPGGFDSHPLPSSGFDRSLAAPRPCRHTRHGRGFGRHPLTRMRLVVRGKTGRFRTTFPAALRMSAPTTTVTGVALSRPRSSSCESLSDLAFSRAAQRKTAWSS